LPVDLGSRAAITPNAEANLKLMVVNLFIYFNSKNTLVINCKSILEAQVKIEILTRGFTSEL
jgi:hypothetical protein